MVSSQKMRRRVLDELERHSSAVGLLQRVDKFAVTIFVILMDDFQLAFELDPLASSLPLRCGGGVNGVCVGGVSENESAADEHHNRQKKCAAKYTGIDPGEDPSFHGTTFRPNGCSLCESRRDHRSASSK